MFAQKETIWFDKIHGLRAMSNSIATAYHIIVMQAKEKQLEPIPTIDDLEVESEPLIKIWR